jgi:hypothetical protein
MNKARVLDFVRETIKVVPSVRGLLSRHALAVLDSRYGIGDAIMPVKAASDFRAQMEQAIRAEYNAPTNSGTFREIVREIILLHIALAFLSAWKRYGVGDNLPAYLIALQALFIEGQAKHIEKLHGDIQAAREKEDEALLLAIIARALLWANQYQNAYNEAVLAIGIHSDKRVRWQYGDTEHCPTCLDLNGIVATAAEWNQIGVRPQSPPNEDIECGGWRCQCAFVVTSEPRTDDAVNVIRRIIGRV